MPSRVRLAAWDPASKFEQEGDEVTEQTFVAALSLSLSLFLSLSLSLSLSPSHSLSLSSSLSLSPSLSLSLSLAMLFFPSSPTSECVERFFAMEEQEEVQISAGAK